MPATLRDVAAHAGVSIRTVSNVVSGYVHVSDTMRRRVQAAIEELDYRPNPVARTLRTGRTGVLALVVPEIHVPYFSELARHTITEAAKHGYRVMIDHTGHDQTRERALLTGNDRTMLFDGILFSSLVTPSELAEMEHSRTIPLVLLGEHEFSGAYDHVAIDNVQAAHDAVTHLASLGRQRIAAIGAQPAEHFSTPLLRTEGYRAALTDAGLERDPSLEKRAARYSREDGYAACLELLDGPVQPDAIFCFSDLLAMGAMRALHDAGLSVPRDVAVIGIDNIDECEYSTPSLSSVSLDTPFIAKEAVRRLVDRIDDPGRAAEEVLAPHRVTGRESTLGPLAKASLQTAV